jgi:hypothetical protein
VSSNPTYKLDLARSSDLVTIESLDVAKSRKLQLALNKPGALTVDLDIHSRVASYLALRSTCAIVSRNGTPIWSGATTAISDDAAAEKTSVTFTGWLEELDHRHVRASEVATLSFVAQIGGTIAMALLNKVNAQTDTGAIVRPTHVVPGAVTDSQVRTRSYKLGDNYGAMIRELIEIENGFDIVIDPLTRKMTTRAPTAYVDRTGVKFGFGVAPNNLSAATRTMDGTTIFNRENAVTAAGVVVSADDATAITTAGIMLEEWLTLSDVGESTIAAAYANAELVYKRYGTITYQISPDLYANIPRPWDDYQLGDKVYFSVDVGRFQVYSQAVRIFSLSIDLDDNGNEIISEIGLVAS